VARACAALLVLLAFVAAGRADETPPPARGGTLQVAEPTWDAGKIVRGTKLTHSFVLKNVGTTELSIDAKPG